MTVGNFEKRALAALEAAERKTWLQRKLNLLRSQLSKASLGLLLHLIPDSDAFVFSKVRMASKPNLRRSLSFPSEHHAVL